MSVFAMNVRAVRCMSAEKQPLDIEIVHCVRLLKLDSLLTWQFFLTLQSGSSGNHGILFSFEELALERMWV